MSPAFGLADDPALTIAGKFIGGSDIMMEMFEAGELEELVTEKGLVKTG